MHKETVTCPGCGTKNRVPAISSGKPVCANCKKPLPWLVNIGESDFDEAIASSTVPVLVDLWAPWCGPCKAIAPVLEALAASRAGQLRIVKVNVDNAPGLQAAMGVQGIPTMVLYDDGKEIARQVGALPGHAMESWLDSSLKS